MPPPSDEMPDGTRAPTLVVLAAGASARLGRCKALVPLAGEDDTPLARLLAAGAGLADDGPLVVAGADFDAIAAAAPRGVEVVRNEAWDDGRTGSVLRAVRARPGRDLCLAPVDVPLVPSSVFAALAARWRAAGAPERAWLAPRLRGDRAAAPRHGHPVVVGRGLLAELEGWPADRPLRELRARAAPLLSAEVDDPEIFDDLDTPADLARLRARLAD